MEYILLLPFSFHTPEKNVFLLHQKTFGASYEHAMTTNRFPWSCTTTFICIVISSDLYILRKMPKSYLYDSQKILFCKGFLLSFDSSTPLGTICIKICLSFNIKRLKYRMTSSYLHKLLLNTKETHRCSCHDYKTSQSVYIEG